MARNRKLAKNPESALILLNIGKDANFGRLIRTADALGAREVVVVGRRRFNHTGHMGSGHCLPRRHFPDLKQARAYFLDEGFRITGIEITAEAKPVHKHPFLGNTAFLPGNEGNGLAAQHRALCDDFVYIPQFGSAQSLNVNVATGIVLHQFSAWAGMPETRRKGEKFLPPETDSD